jgi:hypothetical protein
MLSKLDSKSLGFICKSRFAIVNALISFPKSGAETNQTTYISFVLIVKFFIGTESLSIISGGANWPVSKKYSWYLLTISFWGTLEYLTNSSPFIEWKPQCLKHHKRDNSIPNSPNYCLMRLHLYGQPSCLIIAQFHKTCMCCCLLPVFSSAEFSRPLI